MFRVDHATGATTDPGTTPATQSQPRFFQAGDTIAGTLATVVQAEWLNMMQEELCNAVTASGQVLDKSNRNQLSQALGIGNYVQKTGDIMTGQLAMQGAGTAIQYSPPTTLLYGPWDPQGIGFGWDGVGALRVRVYDSDVGLLPLNIVASNFVQKAGDTMTGQLQTPALYPCFPAAAGCVIQADANNINWTMDPGYYWQYDRGGPTGGSVTWYSPSASIQLRADGTLQATGSLVAGGDVSASGSVRFGTTAMAPSLLSGGNDVALRFDGRAGNIWQLGYSALLNQFALVTPSYPNGAWNCDVNGRTTQFGDVACFQFIGNALDPFAGIVVQTTNCVKATGGEWIGPSDARIKKDVEDYTTGLEQVCALRPVTFKFNGQGGTQDNGRTHIGLIAQEAQAFVPEIFFDMEAMMRNPLDGTPTPQSASMLPGQFGMDASALKYALVNAVKELAARLGALEATHLN